MSIKCGKCKDRHDSVQDVRWCFGVAGTYEMKIANPEKASEALVPAPVREVNTLEYEADELFI